MWRCFSGSSVRNLLLLDGYTNAGRYIDLINETLGESMEKMGIAHDFVFQQDSAPIHKVKKTGIFQ